MRRRQNSSSHVLVGTVLTLLLGLVPAAQAERRNPLEGQPPVRHRVEMRKNRFEITPQFMFSMNQDFRHFLGGSLVLQYHILDWLGVNAQFAYGGNVDTDLTKKLIGGNGSLTDPNNGGTLPVDQSGLQPSRRQFYDHIGAIDYLFSVAASLTPIAGKMSLFGAVFFRYDAYGLIGVGALNMKNGYNTAHPGDDDPQCTGGDPNRCSPANDGLHVAGMFGVGAHFYFNEWAGLNIEMRDYLASTNPSGFDVNKDRKVSSADNKITNNLFFSVGATFMLPPKAKISK